MNLQLLIGQAPAGGLVGFLGSMALPLMIIMVFWFVVFRPARQKQIALEQLIAELKKGDKVVTTGGILGEVTRAEGDTLVLKVADNVRIRVRRHAVAGLESPTE